MIKVVLFDVGKVLVKFNGPQIGLYRLAAKIKKAGLGVAILSNIFPVAGWLLKVLHSYRGFKPIILSCDEGIRKPNPKIFERTIKRLAVEPKEIVFIDNLVGNLKPAKEFGMHVIQAKNTQQVIKDLKQILKTENNLTL